MTILAYRPLRNPTSQKGRRIYEGVQPLSSQSDRASVRGRLSPVGILVGIIGCVIITASSVYAALKVGSLPWPTIFTSITAPIIALVSVATGLGA